MKIEQNRYSVFSHGSYQMLETSASGSSCRRLRSFNRGVGQWHSDEMTTSVPYCVFSPWVDTMMAKFVWASIEVIADQDV